MDHTCTPSSQQLPPTAPPSLEQLWYLYSHIMKYCPGEVRDEVCPQPLTPLSSGAAPSSAAGSSSACPVHKISPQQSGHVFVASVRRLDTIPAPVGSTFPRQGLPSPIIVISHCTSLFYLSSPRSHTRNTTFCSKPIIITSLAHVHTF